MQWFVVRDDKQSGPYTSAELKELAMSGKLFPEDFVRRDDQAAPIQASKVKGLFPDPDASPAEAPAEKKSLDLNKTIKTTADKLEKAQKTAKRLATIATAFSGIAGSVGDILKPLANVNLVIFAVGAVSTLGLLLVCVMKRSSPIKTKFGIACLVTFCVTAGFGVWAGLGALPGDKEKGFLASNIKPVERLQASIVPEKKEMPVPQKAEVAEAPAHYGVEVSPTDAAVIVEGGDAVVTGSGKHRQVVVAAPSKNKSLMLVASRDDYKSVRRTISPSSGSRETVQIQLESVLVGVWRFKVETIADGHWVLFPNGKVNFPNGNDTWEFDGNELAIHWELLNLPVNERTKKFAVAKDRRSFVEKNDKLNVTATKVSDEVPAKPAEPPSSVEGRWLFMYPSGSRRITLLANGKLDSPDSPNTWTFENNILTMRWRDKNAPGGVFVDKCTVSYGRGSFRGKNNVGTECTGRRLGNLE